jgi:hypothetical protein
MGFAYCACLSSVFSSRDFWVCKYIQRKLHDLVLCCNIALSAPCRWTGISSASIQLKLWDVHYFQNMPHIICLGFVNSKELVLQSNVVSVVWLGCN